MSGRLHIVVSWLAVAAWAGFIFFMSAHTGDSLNEGAGFISAVFQALATAQERLLGEGIDVMSPVAHFLEYAVLGALLANALRFHAPWRRAFVLAVVFASLYGATDELHQRFVPDRMADPLDWLVDTCGAGLGVFAFGRVAKVGTENVKQSHGGERRPRRERQHEQST